MAVSACSIGLWGGCVSTSSLVNIWQDPEFASQPLKKMLVVAVRKDATKRRIWEDAFVNELANYGVTATPSYRLYPDALPDTNQIVESGTSAGFDGIMVILQLPTQVKTEYVQGYTTQEQDLKYSPFYYGSYWARYGTYYREIYHPGYTDSQSVDIRTIDVTTTGKDGHLIWSATSRTPDPGSVTDVQEGIVSLVSKKLSKRKIISDKKN